MALRNTVWPAGLPVQQALAEWLEKLFASVDSKAENSGDVLAAMFTEDGTMYGMQGKAAGRVAIAESRKRAWEIVNSRRHEILQLYIGNKDYSDVLLIGRLRATLHNQSEIDTEFVAQIKLQGVTEGRPLGVLYKVWGDSAPWKNAQFEK